MPPSDCTSATLVADLSSESPLRHADPSPTRNPTPPLLSRTCQFATPTPISIHPSPTFPDPMDETWVDITVPPPEESTVLLAHPAPRSRLAIDVLVGAGARREAAAAGAGLVNGWRESLIDSAVHFERGDDERGSGLSANVTPNLERKLLSFPRRPSYPFPTLTPMCPQMALIRQVFMNPTDEDKTHPTRRLTERDFIPVSRVCGLSVYLNASLFGKVVAGGVTEGARAGLDVGWEDFASAWPNLAQKCTDIDSLVFALLDSDSKSYLVPTDVDIIAQEVLRHHSGFEFLEGSPGFQEKYGMIRRAAGALSKLSPHVCFTVSRRAGAAA
ncbi:hypothetical protein BDK51DRAFT_37604 [Blyttiomyces helicus]|uniref:PP2A regulatory subunit B'' EF-hand domain-containing protein n=1 Tax=Blyttiomyces helicus TaxID=388810 RepID=A0A4P9W9T9_9FUNG|nr:hypothetical protein BDK51DRAFT_37604 [Blyttiomyces helicus]|eukprot:RKO89329.1 hypothetical protein BDK51DRAFT_37604 [Blyttiomyces helicus]